MLTLEEMILRLGLAVVLGAIIGLEREYAGKEAGLRTDVMVAAGSAIFTIIGIMLPYIVSTGNVSEIIARNSGFLSVIANIVVGIGFLGAGIIVKHETHVFGLTTAATVWFVSGIGILCGIGLFKFAIVSAISITLLLLFLKKVDLSSFVSEKK